MFPSESDRMRQFACRAESRRWLIANKRDSPPCKPNFPFATIFQCQGCLTESGLPPTSGCRCGPWIDACEPIEGLRTSETAMVGITSRHRLTNISLSKMPDLHPGGRGAEPAAEATAVPCRLPPAPGVKSESTCHNFEATSVLKRRK